MSAFIWFDNSIIRLSDLEDGTNKIGYNCLGGLSHQFTLLNGAIPDGSKVTSYREDGTSDKQWIYHNYQSNLQMLDSKEGEEECVIHGEFILGHGLLVEDPRNPGRYIKHGFWQGDDWSGTYMMGAEIGEWEIYRDELLPSGSMGEKHYQFRITSGSPALVREAPDDFRVRDEVAAMEAHQRERTKSVDDIRKELANRG